MLQICVMVSTLLVYEGRSVMSRSTQYIRFSGLLYYSALFLVRPIFGIAKTGVSLMAAGLHGIVVDVRKGIR